MKKTYQKAVSEVLESTKKIKNDILIEKDIQHLPPAVQKYLHYTGVMRIEKSFIKQQML